MAAAPGRYGIEDVLSRCKFHPGYLKTLVGLRTANPQVSIENNALRFTDYPFKPATVFPSGTVEVEQIAEINLGFPSQVRLHGGDILFVPAPGKEALLTFIHQHNLPIENRISIWGSLLDPFLDTSTDQTSIDNQFQWFADLGLDRPTVDAWRREVAVAMVAYNFGTGLWEWGGLELYDALIAQQARMTRKAFADFYTRAIQLAAMDPKGSNVSGDKDTTVENALFSVLVEWFPKDPAKSPENFSTQWEERFEKIDRFKKQLAAELTLAYSEPHRHYHTLAHIENGLRELDRQWEYAIRLNEVRWALIFHDAVYDPMRTDNEARSADWACRVMETLDRPTDEQKRVRELILATAHTHQPRTPDEALLLDIDLATLSADEASFDDYDRAIRAEYQWVSDEDYRPARIDVLGAFIHRERLYHTAPFRQRCEAAARMNIRRTLARLGAH